MAMLALVQGRSPLAGLVLIGGVFVAFAVYLAWGETIDDAAISFAYAKHLVHGDGLVLSVGAEPVEAYSNFLWVLIMAPVIGVGLNALVGAKVLGLALSLGALFLLARIPGQATGRSMGWMDLLAPALTAVALPFALWSVSGMESALHTFLLVLVVTLSIRELNDERALPWSSLAFFALAITRPEGIVFWIAAVAHRVLLTLLRRRLSVRDVQWLAGFLVLLVIYHLWHYQYFGELVPNTYFAKAEHRSVTSIFDYATSPSDPGFAYVRSFVADYWLLPFLPLLPLSLIGWERLRMYSLPLMLVLAGVASALFVGGDWMEYHRFLSPLIPLFYLGVQEGVRAPLSGLSRLLKGPSALWVQASASLAVAVALLALAVSASATKAEAAHDRPFGAPYSVLLTQAERLERLAQRLGLTEATVLTADIGATAFATDLSIIDLAGLGDAFIARHQGGPALAEYVFGERRPDIITIHGVWINATGLDNDPRLWSDYVADYMESDDSGRLRSGTFVRNDLVLTSGQCADAVPWQRAESLVGQRAVVAGFLTESSIGPQVTLLHFGDPGGPSVAIRKGDGANFKVSPATAYLGRAVCVTGDVSMLEGMPVIYARAPSDILLDESKRVWTPPSNVGGGGFSPPEMSPEETEAFSAFYRGALLGEELETALDAYGVSYVLVADDSPPYDALRVFAAYNARDFEARLGTPDLALRQGGAEEYWAWAFSAIERERVGGERFTVPGDLDPDNPTLDFRIELAPSEPVKGRQIVRVVVSYTKVGGDGETANAVADVALPAGTAAGASVNRLRSPGTVFAPGETYDFVVWRSPDAAEDTYPDDIWFGGLKIMSQLSSLERVEGTRLYVFEFAQ